MPTDTITCPKCSTLIDVDELLRNQLEQTVVRDLNKKHQQELDEQKKQLSDKARKAAIESVRAEYDSKITATKESAQEQLEQNKKLQEQLTQLLKQQRELQSKNSQLELEYQKKLLSEEQKIKELAKKEAYEETALEIAKREKQLADLEKQLELAQKKVQQGSQQLQGEVLELELEQRLTAEFPYDAISEVPKGIRGADIIQAVQTRKGTHCGSLLWELKNTQNWSQSWITKLKADQRELKAECGIIITSTLPKEIESFGQIDGIWITSLKFALPLATALRQQLISLEQSKLAQAGRATSAQVVYDYLISTQFRQRIEVWLEYFADKDEQLRKEESYFRKKWSKERAQLTRLNHATVGIYGDLQGLIGSALPKIKNLELPEELD